VILRPAEDADLPQILAMAEEGTGESAFEGTFNRERATAYLRAYMHWSEASAIVAVEGSEILGGYCAVSSYEMWEEPLCGLLKFWVKPSARRSPVARALVDHVIGFAAQTECLSIYVSASAQLTKTQQRLFENLMKGAGFEYAGVIMKRNL